MAFAHVEYLCAIHFYETIRIRDGSCIKDGPWIPHNHVIRVPLCQCYDVIFQPESGPRKSQVRRRHLWNLFVSTSGKVHRHCVFGKRMVTFLSFLHLADIVRTCFNESLRSLFCIPPFSTGRIARRGLASVTVASYTSNIPQHDIGNSVRPLALCIYTCFYMHVSIYIYTYKHICISIQHSYIEPLGSRGEVWRPS